MLISFSQRSDWLRCDVGLWRGEGGYSNTGFWYHRHL